MRNAVNNGCVVRCVGKLFKSGEEGEGERGGRGGGRKVGSRPNESGGGVGGTEKRVVFIFLLLQIDGPHLMLQSCWMLSINFMMERKLNVQLCVEDLFILGAWVM